MIAPKMGPGGWVGPVLYGWGVLTLAETQMGQGGLTRCAADV